MSTEATKPNGSSKSREIPVINVDIEEIQKKAAAYNVETCLSFIHDEGQNVRKSNRRNVKLVAAAPSRVNHKKRIIETFENGIIINWGGRKNKKREVPASKDKEQEV